MADVNCELATVQATGLQATVLSPDEVARGRIVVQGHRLDFIPPTDGDTINTWYPGGWGRTWYPHDRRRP